MNKIIDFFSTYIPTKFIESVFISFRKIFTVLKKPVVKAVFIGIALIFSAIYFFDQYTELMETIGNLRLSIPVIIISLSLIVTTVFLGTLTWWSLLSFLCYPRDWIRTARAYANSAIAKYIPGYIWQFAGRAYFSNELFIPIKFIGLGLALELIITTLVGGILAGITYLIIGQQFFERTAPSVVAILFASTILLLILIAIPDFLNKFISKHLKLTININKKYFHLCLIFNTLGWLLMGLAYFLILRAFGIFGVSYFSALFFHTTSFVAGTLALPFPNGLVVRETILVLLGKRFLSEHLIIISSLLFRLLILAAEAVVVVIVFVISQSQQKS